MWPSTGWPIRPDSSIGPSGREELADRQRSALADDLRLRAEAPLAGTFKLIRDGEVVLEQVGAAIDVQVDKPGVYRVEVWLTLAGEPRPWILTNPIYVRAENRRSAAGAAGIVRGFAGSRLAVQICQPGWD